MRRYSWAAMIGFVLTIFTVSFLATLCSGLVLRWLLQ
jgi:hypothetical protein